MVASARRSGADRTKIIVGIVVVLLIAGVVIGGVLYTNAQKNKTEGSSITPRGTAASYPVSRDDAVVVVGRPDARVTLDIYEDFLCPVCKDFEDAFGSQIEGKLADGSVRVRYHMVAILNNRSDPEGYSLDSANAALCVADADAGKFPAYHQSLFGAQPQEGARGYDNGQLVKLGNDLGTSSPDFKSCVDSGRHDQRIQAAQQQISSTPYLLRGNRFGTPTVAVGEKLVDIQDAKWLDKLVSAG